MSLPLQACLHSGNRHRVHALLHFLPRCQPRLYAHSGQVRKRDQVHPLLCLFRHAICCPMFRSIDQYPLQLNILGQCLTIFVDRFLAGFGLGISQAVSTVYIAEVPALPPPSPSSWLPPPSWLPSSSWLPPSSWLTSSS